MTTRHHLETVKALNAKIYANEAQIRCTANTDRATLEACYEMRRALAARGKACGFIRIFDGSFKLTAAQVDQDDRTERGACYMAPSRHMTEAQIEEIAERRMDQLDKQLLGGWLKQEEYEAAVADLDKWCQGRLAELKAA